MLGGEREEEEVNVLKLDMDKELVFMHARAKFQDNRNSIVTYAPDCFQMCSPRNILCRSHSATYIYMFTANLQSFGID